MSRATSVNEDWPVPAFAIQASRAARRCAWAPFTSSLTRLPESAEAVAKLGQSFAERNDVDLSEAVVLMAAVEQ